jgi:hypothetical protein
MWFDVLSLLMFVLKCNIYFCKKYLLLTFLPSHSLFMLVVTGVTIVDTSVACVDSIMVINLEIIDEDEVANGKEINIV